MDFLKKHFEKVALVLALLVLIVVAGILVWKAGSLGEQQFQPTRRGQPATGVDTAPYAQAMDTLKNPARWTAPRNPFAVGDIGSTIDAPVVSNGPPVALMEVKREPFKLLFKAYSWDTAKLRPYNIQINFRDFTRTFFVRAVGDFVADPNDRLANTGYRITKFERKSTNVVTNVGPQELDVSEITLLHENEKPIVLPYGREAEEQEPVAVVRCLMDMQSLRVRRAQRFTCGDKTYIVVDINSTQMIIVDAKSEKQEVIPLSR